MTFNALSAVQRQPSSRSTASKDKREAVIHTIEQKARAGTSHSTRPSQLNRIASDLFHWAGVFMPRAFEKAIGPRRGFLRHSV